MFVDKLRRPLLLVGTLLLRIFLSIATGVTMGAAAKAQGEPSIIGQWTSVQTWPERATHAHLLPTGKVMFWPPYDNPHIWDPASNTFILANKAGYNIFCSGHSFLENGQLLVTGGDGGKIGEIVGLRYASTYDPFTGSWTRLPDMNAGRWYPTNVTLPNGDVLVVSGATTSGLNNNLPQVWQTASGRWQDLTTAQDVDVLLYPRSFVAPNGKVFVAGPRQDTYYLDTAGTGAWTPVGFSNFGLRDYGSSVMYDDGKVLIVGGGDPPTESAEVIDLNNASPSWRYMAPMSSPRRYHNATLLPDGKVLVTGGTSGSGDDSTRAVYAAEVWDPATNIWTKLASATVYRGNHSTALLLPDGRVLTAGGDVAGPNAEIYSPPYLFKGSRPTITSAPTSVAYDQTFLVGTPDAGNISQVSWVRLASVTHSFDQNQRINRLSFLLASGGLSVKAPPSGILCPPGHYMLFILNGNGVPSVAKIIRIGAASGALAAPSSLTAKPVSESQIDLTWTDNASDEDGFRIERSLDGTTFTMIAAVGANSNSYSDTGLSTATTYYYRVYAYNGRGNSAYSNVASATTFGPSVVLSPTSLNFAKQFVGTTSAPQKVALTNNGTATLSIASITISGDFAQTNTCGTTVAAGASCRIDFTFTPSTTGLRRGTLTITDNAPGSPHKVALTGTGRKR